MRQESSHRQARTFRPLLLVCCLALIVVLSLVAGAGACRISSPQRGGNVPSPPVTSTGRGGTAPVGAKPKPAPPVKACAASSRCQQFRY
ncbi:MAG: hypothetical protein ABSC36_04365 [Gaiellaceae bacterium]